MNFEARGEFEALAGKIESGSVQSAFSRGLSLFTRIGAAVAVFLAMAGALAAAVRFLDRIG